MGKYHFSDKDKKSGYGGGSKIHPIWSGIGFLLMILIPFLAYFATLQLIQMNQTSHWITFPSEFMAAGNDPYLYIKIIGTILVAVLIYLVFMLFTFIVYGIFGPPRYGPTDAPPPSRKIKRHW